MKILIKSEWREYEVFELANRAPGYKDIIVGGTPDGHYIDFVGDHTHLFAVGCYQGDGAYERSLIVFEMIGQQRINLPSRPEFDGRVVRIDFRKRPPETEQDRQQPDPGLGSVPDGGDALAAATLPAAPEKPSSTARNGNPHPAAEVPNASTFNGMEAGCRFVSTVTGEHGWVDEFLPNGKALVTFDRSGWARVLSIKVVPEIVLINEKAPFLATQKE